MTLDQQDIINLERRYRTQLINSLGGFKSVVLVGSQSPEGNNNLAIISSLFHLGANPALCGFILRPNEEKENTLGNIMRSKQYTLNHVNEDIYPQAHQCSAKYPSGVSEFEQVGLSPEFVAPISAPFVQESRIKFACNLVEKIDITHNGTFMIIGQITKIIVPDDCVSADGFIQLEQAGSLTCSGLDSYHRTQQIARLSYAQPNRALSIIAANSSEAPLGQ